MNILMVTNTYTPHVGGVAKSVAAFTETYRQLGHRVLVIAPEFENMPENESDVIRVPAIQNFNGSDFSVHLPIPGFVSASLDEFRPDIVHSHHPFLLGHTALLVAASFDVPLVFTHHTMYEQYTHYVPLDSPQLKRFVVQLATGYANLSDRVISPSKSIAEVLQSRGVNTAIEVIPTGVDVQRMARGNGSALRERMKIPPEAQVIGHTGRLAPEKNLQFLAEAVAEFIGGHPKTHFLVVGEGPSRKEMESVFKNSSLDSNLHFTGSLKGQDLVDSYHAMDIFAFASKSETQGMVLVEAMAAGVPVVALDAPGVRDVITHNKNGWLIDSDAPAAFVSALKQASSLSKAEEKKLQQALLQTVEEFSMDRSAERALALYTTLSSEQACSKETEDSLWDSALRVIEEEWKIWENIANSAEAAFTDDTRDV
ncbi:MAG: glycosyltransferase [Nitrospinota bacterium]|nr:glycosyltransferase [Nitrospinota bacterium]